MIAIRGVISGISGEDEGAGEGLGVGVGVGEGVGVGVGADMYVGAAGFGSVRKGM